MKIKNKESLKIYFLNIISLFYCAICIFIGYYNPLILSLLVIICGIDLMYTYRNNPMLFFIFSMILYSNYSFIISKYVGSGTPNLVKIYQQVQYNDTMAIGLYLVTIFISSLKLIIGKPMVPEKDVLETNTNIRFSKIISFGCAMAVTFIILDYFFLHIFNLGREIYEYALIIFIYGFFYCKHSNFNKYVLIILMLIAMLKNMIDGGRIISLQPVLVFIFCFLYNRINYKNTIIVLIGGILVFTFAGVYGDFKDYGYDLSNLNIKVVWDIFKGRKFALDTSISAYWTGLTYVEYAHFIPFKSRILNFVQFITKYLVLGTKSGYQQLYFYTRQMYTHYYGGYLVTYFYYWFGWIGSIICPLLIGLFLRMINTIKSTDSDFKKMTVIYITATMLRWYLYYPIPLFRGYMIFSVIYLFLKIFHNLLIKSWGNGTELDLDKRINLSK